MAINKKLIHFATKANFNVRLANSEIDSKSIVFIQDTGEIWTHGKIFNSATWGTNQTNYVPLTIGGTTYNLSKDGHSHSYLGLAGGTLSGDLNFSNAGGNITWNSDSYQQRIKTTDDGSTNTPVFTFQQSANSGSSWADLFTVKDNGYTIAEGYTKVGSSDSHVLLGGGGHKSWSDFNYEANLQWGGKNFSGSYGCIDAAMVPFLGANRLAFALAAGITIEYSRDSGATWLDYGASDATKLNLTSGASGAGLVIGKADSVDKATAEYQLRVTFNTSVCGIYTQLNKFCLYISTSGSSGVTCTIEKALESSPDTYTILSDMVPISGWSGYNIINTPAITTYGNTAASQYGRIRFIFRATGGSTTYNGLQVSNIYGFGGVGWVTPSNMARWGQVYSYNSSQEVTFPAKVTATSFSGNATSATKVTSTLTRGSYLTGSNFDGSAATTWAVDATSANTASKVVARDGSGNFSANIITASLSGNAATATTATNLSGGTISATTGSFSGAVTFNSDILIPKTNGWGYIKNPNTLGGIKIGTGNSSGVYTDALSISAAANYVRSEIPLIANSSLSVTGKTTIKKDLGANLADWVASQHNGAFEVGRSTNAMCVAIGVTDDNVGYIQVKGSNITTPGNLTLLPGGGTVTIGSPGNANLAVTGNVTAPTFIGNLNGNASSAGNADTVDSQHFSYTNTSDSPTYLWGTNDSGTNFLVNRSNMAVNSANYANRLSTNYVGGQQLNPQTYFGMSVGLKVAMTASINTWNDTLWINGYSGGDVLNMCALHFMRNGEPRMYISAQNSNATTYGTMREILSTFNISSHALPIGGGTVTGNTIFQLGLRAGGMDSNNTNNAGISLRSDQSQLDPMHGLYFGATSLSGTHGAVTGNSAVYFTVDDTTNRGWIFRQNWPGAEANVASISNTGNMTLNGYLKVAGGDGVVGIKNNGSNTEMYFGTQLKYKGLGGISEYVITSRLYNTNPSSPTVASYNKIPMVIWHGRIQISATAVYAVSYQVGAVILSGTRVDTGTATLTMTSYSGGVLPASKTDYMVVGTGMGTSDTSTSCSFVTIPDSHKYSNSFRIMISDDSTRNDGYAEIMIIQIKDPGSYPS